MIDADELIKHIKSYTGVFNNTGYYTRNDLIVKAINETPTAYDVDAVVSELEKERKSTYAMFEKYGLSSFWREAYAFVEAIKIVKRGGRDD